MELPHERVRAVGGPGADAGRGLGVAPGELVHVDGDHLVAVVELDRALVPEEGGIVAKVVFDSLLSIDSHRY